jgi:hypothetical protein
MEEFSEDLNFRLKILEANRNKICYIQTQTED